VKIHARHVNICRKWYDNFIMVPNLHISQSPTAKVSKLSEDTWRLEVPANAKRGYRLAQLDEHGSQRRGDFPWKPPLKLHLQARVSAQDIPGTWGFGLWNDPFSFLIAYGGIVPRLPTLPDAAWFFHASPENYLSFRDDLPGSGFLAATFNSKKIPAGWLMLTAPLLSLTLIPGAAQLVRRLLRRVVHQESALVDTRVTDWHFYSLDWEADRVCFSLDGIDLLQTRVAPKGPLSLVIWVDNQYAALPPRGRLAYGTLPNPEPAWMEIRGLSIQADTSPVAMEHT
jgi:hypothetical protein